MGLLAGESSTWSRWASSTRGLTMRSMMVWTTRLGAEIRRGSRRREEGREISLFASRHVCRSKREGKKRRLAPFEMTVVWVADGFAGVKWKEKASACSVRNDGGGVADVFAGVKWKEKASACSVRNDGGGGCGRSEGRQAEVGPLGV